jgi:RNA polymerase sigma factor (sigma-70 family)
MQEQSASDLKVLVDKARESTQAFEHLMRALDSKIFAYCLSRVKNRDTALIVTQDVFVDLWKALPTLEYRNDGALYGFVYTIARRRIMKEWNLPVFTSLEEAPEIVDQTDHFPEQHSLIPKALKKLDALSREIVVLRHWSEQSFLEIATILKLKEDAVRMRHHRALKKLQKLLPMYAEQ